MGHETLEFEKLTEADPVPPIKFGIGNGPCTGHTAIKFIGKPRFVQKIMRGFANYAIAKDLCQNGHGKASLVPRA